MTARKWILGATLTILLGSWAVAQREATSTINQFTHAGLTYSFDIWACSTGPTAIRVGTSQFFFDYDTTALANPTLSNINPQYTGVNGIDDYDSMVVAIVARKIAVTITFTGNNTGTGQILSTTSPLGERICTVILSITNAAGTPNLMWDTVNSAITASTSHPVTNIFVGSDNGPLAVPLQAALPTEYALHANYPNPFNPSTTISYDLPEPSFVQVTVYNILGQEVASLVNGVVNAGYQRVVWNAMNNSNVPLASGVYVYRMEATSTTSTREFRHVMKAILIK
jgi:hypothetical protein